MDEALRLIGESAAGWLRRHHDFAARQRLVAAHHGRPSDMWAEFAAMGWLALPLPERVGGFGADPAPLMREFGAALVVEPYVATVLLGGALLAELGQDAMAAAAAEGRAQLALAHEPEGEAVARRDGAGWVIEGVWPAVLNGDTAETLLVVADGEVFAVPRGTPGMTAEGWRGFDGHRAARITLHACALPAAASLGPAEPALSRVLARAMAALLAEAVGAMEAAVALTTTHLKTRRQFGRPLAEFQVLRHRLVDMWIATEEARSMAAYAAEALGFPDAAEAARVLAAAKVHVARTGRLVGQQAIQLHGAIGLTEECAIGHYAARLEAIGAAFGDADHHLAIVDAAS
jgi:alkylation response protein AidB-like acyl-CoA dehydrogenase